MSFKKLDSFKYIKKPFQNEKRVFIFLAADYGNLGDVAITCAQHKFLQSTLDDYEITEIPISVTQSGIAFVKKVLHESDIITIVGGGNMGDLYPMIEYSRRMVIANFPNNKIVCFPQTVDFNLSNTKGRKPLRKSVKKYGKHKNLTLVAREQKTFDFFKNNYRGNNVVLTPDIVLTLDRTFVDLERKGAIICLRDDKEKKLSNEQEENLHLLIKEEFGTYTVRDTHIGGQYLPLINRVRALYKIWDDFKKAELVITDRLHGMIFCFITNTPVLVFLNNNHKIKSSYEWIKNSPLIHLMDDFSESTVRESIKKLRENKSSKLKEDLSSKYIELVKTLKR